MLVAESGREGGRGEEDEIRKAMGQCFPFVLYRRETARSCDVGEARCHRLATNVQDS